jgi:hypothetical protein
MKSVGVMITLVLSRSIGALDMLLVFGERCIVGSQPPGTRLGLGRGIIWSLTEDFISLIIYSKVRAE